MTPQEQPKPGQRWILPGVPGVYIDILEVVGDGRVEIKFTTQYNRSCTLRVSPATIRNYYVHYPE